MACLRVPGPDPRGHHVEDAEDLCQPVRAPMRRADLRPTACCVQNPRFELGCERRHRLPAVRAIEPRQPLRGEAATPAPNVATSCVRIPTQFVPSVSNKIQRARRGSIGHTY